MEWHDIFNTMKGETYNQNSTQQGSNSNLMAKIKSFTDKQKLREFSTSKSVFQKMLKELL